MLKNYGQGEKNNLILGFFFLTGLTGLAYELVWIRLLILAFGSTQFAVTTVLVVFMAGLALGSLIFGRLADRVSTPLRIYAAIEILLGVYCVLSPWVFSLVKSLYLHIAPITESAGHRAGFEGAQFALAFLALIIPTTLMGGTLPVLVKFLASSSGRIGYHTAVPYAVNTLGAVTGCLVTGLFALYTLGVKTTVYTAGIIDMIVGALILFIYGKVRTEAVTAEASAAPSGSIPSRDNLINIIVIAAFALSGFCSLTYEVLWTRVLSLVLGSSVYAFTVMLATFLVGIGIGSIALAPLVDRCRAPMVWFAILEAVIGVVALLSIFIYRELPFIFYNLKEAFAHRFWFFLFLQFLVAAAIMIIPTLSMGAIFPLVGKIYSRGLNTIGRKIGDIYFFNTAGSIFGSFAGGFIIIPLIGVQNGVVLTAGLNILIAIVLLYISGVKPALRYGWGVAMIASFAVMAAILPPWEKMAMTMGLYVHRHGEGKEKTSFKDWNFKENLLYYNEGLNAIITVKGSGPENEVITYQANGKQEARSERGHPAESWSILGHVPMMLHAGEPKDALLVGLGSGITLGAMEYYPLRSIDVVELESAVIDAARFFSKANNSALDDPRVRLHVTDGRSFLSAVDRKYDVIVSGVSDPWISGVSNLFTYDYFMELKSRLNKGGVVALWFSNYRNTPAEFRTGLKTFAAVFPQTSIWFHYTDTLDLVVIGTEAPHALDMKRLESVFATPGIRAGLARINIQNPYDVFSLYLTGNADLRRYLGDAAINTDERPILEFSLPRNLYMEVNGVERVEELLAFTEEVIPPVRMAESERPPFYLELGKTYNRFNFRLSQAEKVFGKALEASPKNAEAKGYLEALRKETGRK